MDKTELKKVLKPLVKQCVKEALLEEDVLDRGLKLPQKLRQGGDRRSLEHLRGPGSALRVEFRRHQELG